MTSGRMNSLKNLTPNALYVERDGDALLQLPFSFFSFEVKLFSLLFFVFLKFRPQTVSTLFSFTVIYSLLKKLLDLIFSLLGRYNIYNIGKKSKKKTEGKPCLL